MPSSDLPPPIVLAMVICDHVHRDPASGKHFLLGTFNTILGRSFPMIHRAMTLYLAITEVSRPGSLRVQIVDVDERRDPLFVRNAEIRADDPRRIVETAIVIANVTFPEPNEYRLQILFNEQVIGERRIVAAQREDKKT